MMGDVTRGLPERMGRFVNTWGRRVNLMVSVIYTFVITCLQIAVWSVYLMLIRHIVWDLLSFPWAVVHTCMCFYLLISVAINYAACLLVRPSTPPLYDIESDSAALWDNDQAEDFLTKSQMQRICETCDAPKPPRTHHCSICRRCYVRLCHHCPALGICVARDNYGYFFRFIGHAFLGSLFASATCKWLMNDWKAWSGGLDAKETNSDLRILVYVMMGGLGVACATGILFSWNVFLASSGQTTIEFFDNRHVRKMGMAPAKWGWFGGPFSKDIRSNLQDALGVPVASFLPWWSVFLIPVGRSPRE